MNTQEQRLMWLLEFAQLKLAGLKEWEQLKLRTELKEFLSSEPGVSVAFDQDPLAISESDAGNLQLEAYKALGMFSPIIKKPAYWDKVLSSREGFKFTINPKGSADGMAFDTRIISTVSKADIPVEIRGSLQALFENSLLAILKDTALRSRIAECPECHRLFLRVRKQIYCSKRCINRVSRSKWLKDPDNQKKESDWAHERYEKRVKKLKGENVKVQRRTRRTKGQTK